jgi:hypothetical protein
VPRESLIFKEFEDIAALTSGIINERNTRGCHILGFRDGIFIMVERTFSLIFGDLLRIMVHAEEDWWNLNELKAIIEDINHGLTSMFGYSNIMAKRTQNWLMVVKTNADNMTRHKAIEGLRDLFPRSSELTMDTYKQFKLNELDVALERGLKPWVKETKKESAIFDNFEKPQDMEVAAASSLGFSGFLAERSNLRKRKL